MNLPNKLTVLRVIMVPFFVFFMLTGVGGAANKWIALIIFCVASLSDVYKRQADNDIVIAASYWGKFKTVSQMFMLILLIADLGGAFNMIAQVLIWVSLVLTIVSLIDYIAKNVQVLTQGGM